MTIRIRNSSTRPGIDLIIIIIIIIIIIVVASIVKTTVR
jgi:hypothetical protein